MKKLLVIVFAIVAISASAQKKTPVKKTTATATKTVLKNLRDSASYALGLSVANFYKQQGLKDLNATVLAKAINDVQTNKPKLLTDQQMNEVIMFYMDPNLQKRIIEGRQFLAANKTKPGIKTTASGLQYEVLKEGQGPKPKLTDTVVVNYVGKLLDGKEFDNSYSRGQPIEFSVGGVIKGWTEALQLMSAGSKYRLFIPYEIGYGLTGNGPIPGGAPLIFEVELLGIKGK